MALGVVGIKANRLAECSDRLLMPPHGLQNVAEVVVGCGEAWGKANRLAHLGQRLVEATGPELDRGQVDAGPRALGLEAHRLAEFGGRKVESIELGEREAELVVVPGGR